MAERVQRNPLKDRKTSGVNTILGKKRTSMAALALPERMKEVELTVDWKKAKDSLFRALEKKSST